MAERNIDIEPSALKALLHKHLQAKTTPQEENWLKEAAEKDPFLSEALEGFMELEDKTIAIGAIAEIDEKVKRVSKDDKPVWLGTAAAVVALLIVAFVWVWLPKSYETGEMAMEKRTKAPQMQNKSNAEPPPTAPELKDFSQQAKKPADRPTAAPTTVAPIKPEKVISQPAVPKAEKATVGEQEKDEVIPSEDSEVFTLPEPYTEEESLPLEPTLENLEDDEKAVAEMSLLEEAQDKDDDSLERNPAKGQAIKDQFEKSEETNVRRSGRKAMSKRSIAPKSDDDTQQFERGIAFIEKGKAKKAFKIFQELAEAYPGSVSTSFWAIHSAIILNDLESAILLLKQWTERNPDSDFPPDKLLSVLEAGDPNQAKQIIDKWSKANPEMLEFFD